jgi:DTW domain-containing protein YfiP
MSQETGRARFSGPASKSNAYNKELEMKKRAATFLAIGAMALAGAVAVLAPTSMTSEVEAATTVPESEPFVYFPAQYVNQATAMEETPPTF